MLKRWGLNKEIAALRDICDGHKPSFATFTFMVLPLYPLVIGLVSWLVFGLTLSGIFVVEQGPFMANIFCAFAAVFGPLIILSFLWGRQTAMMLEGEWFAKHWSPENQQRAQSRLIDAEQTLAELT